MNPIKDQVAIAGVGQTPFTRNSGVSALALAVMSARDAIADAGLTPKDIDGLILFYSNEPISAERIAANLGIPELRWSLNVAGGGNNGGGIVINIIAC